MAAEVRVRAAGWPVRTASSCRGETRVTDFKFATARRSGSHVGGAALLARALAYAAALSEGSGRRELMAVISTRTPQRIRCPRRPRHKAEKAPAALIERSGFVGANMTRWNVSPFPRIENWRRQAVVST